MSEINAEHLEQQPTAEKSPTEQAWSNFHEAWRIPESNREEYREHFETVVDRVKGECLDPALAEQLETGADFYRWFFFADRGDPLPKTLALRKVPDAPDFRPRYAVSVHPDNPAAVYGYSGVVDKFTELAQHDLDRILESGGHNSDSRLFQGIAMELVKARARDSMAEIIKTSPVYSLLQSFNQPAPEQGDRPLSAIERQVREATINQQVRQKHALTDNQPVPFRSQPDLEIRKQVIQLDDETVSAKPKTVVSPAQRARDYFVAKALEIYKRSNTTVQLLQYDSIGRPLFTVQSNTRPSTQESFYHAHDGIGWAVSCVVVKEVGGEDYLTAEIEQRMISYLLMTLNTSSDWNESLDNAVDTFARRYTSLLSLGGLSSLRNDRDGETMHNNLVGSPEWYEVIKPEGPVFETTAYSPLGKFPDGGIGDWVIGKIRPQVNGFEDQEKLDRTTVATVTRSPEAIIDTKSRLVILDGTLPKLPLTSVQYDLELNFSRPETKNVLIPGYQLVAANHDSGVFQFVKNESDPYDVPEILLGEANIQELTEYYQLMQMPALIEGLKPGPVSIASLARIISNNSDYTYNSPPENMLFDVRNGRPQMQCTGAAYLLQKSLMRALSGDFDTHTASSVMRDGYVLNPGSNTITALGHRQVNLTVNGGSYLLDATPAGDIALRSGGEFVAARSARRERFLTRFSKKRALSKTVKVDKVVLPKNTPEVLENTPEPKTEPVYESVAAQRAAERPGPAELRSRLEQQLMAALHAPNTDTLMKRVLQQSQDDPVRRTLSLAVQSTGKEGITTDIAALKSYVIGYERLTPQQRKQYRLAAYDQNMIGILSAYIDELSLGL